MRLLYLYPSSTSTELPRVLARDAPTDRMYGLVELRQRGHTVDIADGRFQGNFGRAVKALRRYSLNICDLQTLRSFGRYDAVIVKDEFSPLITLACRRVGRKVVYLDALSRLPSGRLRRRFLRWNILRADAVIGYSKSQIWTWATALDVPPRRMAALPYTIDLSFYRSFFKPAEAEFDYVLSVGRDPGRDVGTLVKAMEGLRLQLKLVTRPYLLRATDVARPWIEIHDHLSYPDLFDLYAGASLIAIPLKSGTTHPSGIRALLEATALGRPVVATHSPVLQEYFPEGKGVTYVPPDDPEALRARIVQLAGNSASRAALASAGRDLVTRAYGMDAFVNRFERLLQELP